MQTKYFSLVESIKRRIVRIEISQVFIAVCVVLLAIWCAYNIKEIFIKYYQDDTIISLENSPPGITEFPGITICAPSIFKPQKLAEMFPTTFGVKFKKYRRWRLTNSGDEVDQPDISNHTTRLIEIAHYESEAMKNFTALQILQNYSVRFEELISSCDFFPINIRKLHTFSEDYVPNSYECASLHPVLESIYEKKKCFTFFSKMREKLNNTEDENLKKNKTISRPNSWGNKFGNNSSNCSKQVAADIKKVMPDDNQSMNFDFNPSIEITITNVENDIWYSYLTTAASVVMTVHPPDIAQSRRDFLFFQVSKSTFNEITFTQKTTTLLDTSSSRCVNYNKHPYENVPTRDYCISMCVLQNNRNKEDCVNYFGVLSLNIFKNSEYSDKYMCTPEKQKYESYLDQRKVCESKCLPECVKTIFEVSGQMRNTALSKQCRANWWQGISADSFDDASVSNDTKTDSVFPEDEQQFNQYQLYSKVLPATGVENTKVTQSDKTESSESAEMDNFMNTVLHTTKYLRLRQVNSNYQVKGKTFSSKRSKRSRAPTDWEPSDANSNCTSQVSVRISPKPFTVVKHQKAISTETFIGTIGGHLGIWLGLSLYKIIKFAVHTAYRLVLKIIGDCSKSFNYNMCS